MQPESSAVVQWFYTNAPAAWLSAVIALFSLTFVLVARKRPNRVLVRLISASSLVKIWSGVKEKIALTFEGKNVTALGLLEFTIANTGSDAIKQASITFTIPSSSQILGVQITPSDCQATCTIDQNRFTVLMPYLNPHRDHYQVFDVTALVDGQLEPISVSGIGEGWSARYQGLPTDRQLKRNRRVLIMLLFLFGAITFFYMKLIEQYFGVPGNEYSLRSAVASLPLVIGMIGVSVLSYRTAFYYSARLRPRRDA